MRKQILTAVLLAGCAGATTALAADLGPDTTIGGVAFFDLSHISLQNDNAAGAKVDTAPTGTGFDIKRFYLVVNHRFNDVWSANLTSDAQFTTASTTTVSTPTGGTANALINQNSSGGVSEVFIKKLYLQGKFDNAFIVRIGSSDTPWIPYIENLYFRRYVEKSALDRLGLGNTADWGVNASGILGNGLFDYSASVVNGGGFKNPTRTEHVDFEARVAVKPVDWLRLVAGFYSGHLGQVTAVNNNFPTNTGTRFDLAAAVSGAGFRVGAEYFSAKNYKTVNNLGASAYGSSAIVTAAGTPPASDKAEGFSTGASYTFDTPYQYTVFARYDQAKLSKDVAPNLKDTYVNVGVSFKPLKTVEFALVYKNEKVENGSVPISSGDANSSFTIGGATGAGSGKFDEIGIYSLWSF